MHSSACEASVYRSEVNAPQDWSLDYDAFWLAILAYHTLSYPSNVGFCGVSRIVVVVHQCSCVTVFWDIAKRAQLTLRAVAIGKRSRGAAIGLLFYDHREHYLPVTT